MPDPVIITSPLSGPFTEGGITVDCPTIAEPAPGCA